MEKEFPDIEQRLAVCYQKWDDKNKKAIHALPHISSRIFNVPLLITPDRLDEIIIALNERINIDINAEQLASLSNVTSPVVQRSLSHPEIAIIPVRGTLVHRGGFIESKSGIQSYDQIRSMYTEALDNPGIKKILWDFGSPGGEVAGLFDLVDYIYANRGEKPMVAVINEAAYSAAYAMASAVGRIYITRTAGAGSIGVIYRHLNLSKAEENAGIKYVEIIAGARKNELSPHKPLSQETITSIQEQVNDVYNLFTSTVARNLDISEDIIKGTEAAIYMGQKAINAGLAHELASYADAINYLMIRHEGGTTMAGEAKTEDPGLKTELAAAETLIGQLRSEIDEQKDVIIGLNKDLETKLEAQLVEERSRILELIAVCDAHNTHDLLSDFISKGASIDDANKLVLEMVSVRSKAENIINTQTKGDGDGSPNPLLETCKQRAAEARAV